MENHENYEFARDYEMKIEKPEWKKEKKNVGQVVLFI